MRLPSVTGTLYESEREQEFLLEITRLLWKRGGNWLRITSGLTAGSKETGGLEEKKRSDAQDGGPVLEELRI